MPGSSAQNARSHARRLFPGKTARRQNARRRLAGKRWVAQRERPEPEEKEEEEEEEEVGRR